MNIFVTDWKQNFILKTVTKCAHFWRREELDSSTGPGVCYGYYARKSEQLYSSVYWHDLMEKYAWRIRMFHYFNRWMPANGWIFPDQFIFHLKCIGLDNENKYDSFSGGNTLRLQIIFNVSKYRTYSSSRRTWTVYWYLFEFRNSIMDYHLVDHMLD